MDGPERRQLLVSKGWIQAVCLVVLCGFFILGLLAYRTYLRRSSEFVRRAYGGPGSDSAARTTVADLRTNRYDKRTGTLRLTAAQAAAFRALVPHYSAFFSDPKTTPSQGLRIQR